MKNWTPKAVCATILVLTVSLSILFMIFKFMTVPPGTVPEATKEKMFQLITFIAGIVSGWILRGDGPEEKKEEKPK